MRGFTLIELLVSSSLFIIAIFITTGVFLTALSGERRGFAERRALDALRSGLEVTARELRTGSGFPATCGSGCTSLSFTNDEGRTVAYRLESGCVHRNDGVSAGCITPRQLSIERLNLIVSGAGSGDNVQPRVTLALRVRSRVGREEATFDLATSVTQRKLDF